MTKKELQEMLNNSIALNNSYLTVLDYIMTLAVQYKCIEILEFTERFKDLKNKTISISKGI